MKSLLLGWYASFRRWQHRARIRKIQQLSVKVGHPLRNWPTGERELDRKRVGYGRRMNHMIVWGENIPHAPS